MKASFDIRLYDLEKEEIFEASYDCNIPCLPRVGESFWFCYLEGVVCKVDWFVKHNNEFLPCIMFEPRDLGRKEFEDTKRRMLINGWKEE